MTMSWLADRKGDDDRGERGHRRAGARVGEAEREDRQRQQRLDRQGPAAPPAEPRRQQRDRQPVDQRRPQEFQAVGRAHQPEQPDRGQRHADLGEPVRQGAEGQGQRQPARKPHHEDRDEAGLPVHRERGAPALRVKAPAPGSPATGFRDFHCFPKHPTLSFRGAARRRTRNPYPEGRCSWIPGSALRTAPE